MNIEMIHVRARHDDPIHAVQVEAGNILDLAARFSGTVVTEMNVTTIDGGRSEAILFAMEQRYNLQDKARVGDFIVKHPGTLRTIEILSPAQYARAYVATALDGPPTPDLDAAVAAEVDPYTVQGYIVLIENTQGGIYMVRNRISPAHGIGLMAAGHQMALRDATKS